MAAAPSSARAVPRAAIDSRSDANRRDAQPASELVVGPSPASIVANPPARLSDASGRAVPCAAAGSFGRDARILTPAEFDRCLSHPALLRAGSFALHLCMIPPAPPPSPDGEAAASALPHWRLGLVIPKRFEASAVARNTIKRRWRDAFRRGRAGWADEFGSADVVVRMQSPLIPKPAGKSGKRAAQGRALATPASTMPATVPPASLPAKVRARARFEPGTALTALVDRLRARGAPARRADGPRA